MKNITPFRSGCGRMFVNFGAGRNGWRTSLLVLGASVGMMSHLQAATDTWNGGGLDSNWMTANNWGGTAPSAGDILTFAGSTRLTPSNNFGTGTNFGGIAFAAAASSFTLSGASIALTGNITNNSTNAQNINLGVTLNGATTITNSFAGGSIVFGSSSGTGNGAITGTGPLTIVDADTVGTATSIGTTTLAGADNFTGATTLTGGVVKLDYGTVTNSAKLDYASSLTLGGTSGGVRLSLVNGNAASTATTETVSNTVIGNGFSIVSVANGGTNSAPALTTFNLGTVTQTAGGTLLIAAPNSVGGNTGLNGVVTANGTNGTIVGGFAIYANGPGGATTPSVDWAAFTGTTGSTDTIGAYTGYSSTISTGANVGLTATSTNTGSPFTINTLRFSNSSGGQTLTLTGANTITAGGILLPIGFGLDTITGGSLSAAANTDLNIFVGSSVSTLTISSNITGGNVNISPESSNTAGIVDLTGTANSFSGNINVTRSTLELGNTGALPTGSSNTITLTSDANIGTNATLQDITSGTITIAATHDLIQGNGGVTNSGGGTLALNGGHTYTGVTNINNNSIISTDTLANGGVASGIGASSNAASNLLLGGSSTWGELIYTGSATTSTDRLLTLPGTSPGYTNSNYIENNGSGVLTFSNTGSIVVSATSGNPQFGLTGSNTGNNIFDPIIGNGTGTSNGLVFNKYGTGTWILGGAETYTGLTSVAQGKLLIGTGGSLSSSTAVAVAAGATFGTASTNTTKMNIFSSTSTAALSLTLGVGSANQSDLEFNLFGGSNSDLLNAGTLTLTGVGGSNTILLTLDNPTNATLSGPYNLLSWSGSTNLTASEVTLASGDPVGSLSVANDTLIFTVPEPSSWLLLLGGAGMLFVYRRSRVRDIS